MIDQAARGKKISISGSARLVMGIVAASGLLEGLDDIGLTFQHQFEIAAYEARHPMSGSMKQAF